MSRISHYIWRAYGTSIDDPACQMVGYFQDPDHVPQKWQEDLYAQQALDAFAIVDNDRKKAELTGKFRQIAINEEQRWYLRTSEESCNSWEVVLDSSNAPLPDPCPPITVPPVTLATNSLTKPVAARRNFVTVASRAKLVEKFKTK